MAFLRTDRLIGEHVADTLSDLQGRGSDDGFIAGHRGRTVNDGTYGAAIFICTGVTASTSTWQVIGFSTALAVGNAGWKRQYDQDMEALPNLNLKTAGDVAQDIGDGSGPVWTPENSASADTMQILNGAGGGIDIQKTATAGTFYNVSVPITSLVPAFGFGCDWRILAVYQNLNADAQFENMVIGAAQNTGAVGGSNRAFRAVRGITSGNERYNFEHGTTSTGNINIPTSPDMRGHDSLQILFQAGRVAFFGADLGGELVNANDENDWVWYGSFDQGSSFDVQPITNDGTANGLKFEFGINNTVASLRATLKHLAIDMRSETP